MGRRPVISEHVVVRWLERIGGVDLNFVRDAIIADTEAAVAVSAKRCAGKHGARYALDPDTGVVLTVLREDQKFGGRTTRRSPRDFREEDTPDAQ